MGCIVGIDLGTSSVKVVVIDDRARIRGTGTAAYPLHVPAPGVAEQDPEAWWAATVTALHAALGIARVSPREISGVGLSGQMHGLVLIDRQGVPVRPCLTWADQRGVEECREIEETVGLGTLLEATGNRALPSFLLPKLLWLRRHETAALDRARWLLFPKDYIRFRLTGEAATDPTDASAGLLLNLQRREWATPILNRLELPQRLLPRLVESAAVSGHVTGSAAAETGLATGTPVAGGAGDQEATAVGAGVITPDLGLITLGSGGQVFYTMATPTYDPESRVHTFCHALPGRWHLLGAILTAGLALSWWDGIARHPPQEAGASGLDGPAGPAAETGGLLFLPYLLGERTPHLDPSASGAFVGLSLHHTPGDLRRAVMEGIAFALRQALECVEAVSGPPGQIRVAGGGSKSERWMQILTDVLGRPIELLEVEDAAALGAALLAAVAVGEYDDLPDACRAAVRCRAELQPEPSRARYYDALYPLFTALYPQLRGFMHALRQPRPPTAGF